LTAVGPAVVLFFEAKVEVTDCTTWETVIVFVSVAVEVMVVVEESAATRPRRRREGRRDVRRILNEWRCIDRDTVALWTRCDATNNDLI
jgi:hypothetical protein